MFCCIHARVVIAIHIADDPSDLRADDNREDRIDGASRNDVTSDGAARYGCRQICHRRCSLAAPPDRRRYEYQQRGDDKHSLARGDGNAECGIPGRRGVDAASVVAGDGCQCGPRSTRTRFNCSKT